MVTGRNQVRGLTTAACLWVCACEGLAAGIGFVDGAFYGLILIAVTLKLLPARKTSKTQPFFAPQDSSLTDIGIFYETKKSRKHPYFYVCLSALNLTGFIISNLLTFCQSVSMLRRTEDPVRM